MRKEKKKLVKELIESNNSMTMALADQTRRSSTLEGQIDELTRQLTASAASLTEATQLKDKMKAKCSAKKLELQELKTKIYDAEKASKTNIADLTEQNQKLTCERNHVSSMLSETEDQLASLQEKYEKLRVEQTQMTVTNKELKKELLSAEATVREATRQYQRIEKEFLRVSEKYEYLREEHSQIVTSSEELRKRLLSAENAVKDGKIQSQRIEQENQRASETLARMTKELSQQKNLVVELRKQVHGLKKEKSHAQHVLDTQTSALRLQATLMSRQLQKSDARVDQMQNDKLNLISYFHDKLARANDNTRPAINLDMDTPRILFPVYPQVEYLQNKVFSLESQLYRQSQLIEELTSIIVSHDPTFDLQNHPHLKVYVDNTWPSVCNTHPGDICVETISSGDDGEDYEAHLVMNAVLECIDDQDETNNAKPYQDSASEGLNELASTSTQPLEQGEPEIAKETPNRVLDAPHSSQLSIFALTSCEDTNNGGPNTRV